MNWLDSDGTNAILLVRQFWHAESLRHLLCLLPRMAGNPFYEVLEQRAERGVRRGEVKLYGFFRRQQRAHVGQK